MRRFPNTQANQIPIAALIALLFAAQGRADPRPLSTDRPDATESPYTVPAGWFQLEMDAVSYTWTDDGLFRDRTWGVAATNLKLGLATALDLQILFEPWVHTRSKFVGHCILVLGACPDPPIDQGAGEAGLRLKWNLLGNDGGPIAVALLPWVTRAMRGGDHRLVHQAGLALPVAVGLPAGMGFGAMAQFSGARGERALLGTATIGVPVRSALGAFVEIALERAFLDGPAADLTRGTFDLGATHSLGEDAQLDVGARFGLTEHSEDVAAFAGLSIRRLWR